VVGALSSGVRSADLTADRHRRLPARRELSLAKEIVALGAAIRLRAAVHGMSRSGDRAVRPERTARPLDARVVVTSFAFLGVHFTRQTSGELRTGPNAV
jgi:L-2-hydroxyglutarate oxidase LhgO